MIEKIFLKFKAKDLEFAKNEHEPLYSGVVLENSFSNNFSLFQLKSIKEITKKVAHGEKITKCPI